MMAEVRCGRCREEVRKGWRHGVGAWLHREDVDHVAILGRAFTAEDAAEVERQRHLPRVREDKDGNPVTYTVAEWERQKMDKKKRDALASEESDDEEDHAVIELEPIEVHCTPMPHKGSLQVETPRGPREVPVPGGVRTILNLAEKVDWKVTRLTYARGPYLGVSGKSLGVSDSVVLHIRGPVVDGAPVYGVASWRDGKSDSVWRVVNGQLEQIGARALIAWMKESPCG